MTIAGQQRVTAPEFPPGVDGRALLAPVFHGAWRLPARGPGDRGGTDYRRAITRYDPLLFAVTYFGRALRDQDTGLMSFCPFHMDAFRDAQEWPRRVPQRSARVAPRRTGKSVLYFRALPAWALAHGHRRFFAAFSHIDDQAKKQLGNLLDILHRRDRIIDEYGHRASDLLLADFPELVPVRGAGGPGRTVLTGGATIAAYGLATSTLGEVSDVDRPDLMVIDDPEPGEADYGPKVKRKAISRLTQNVLPMNDKAVVVVTGTTVANGSMMHDVVKAAKGEQPAAWLAEENITPYYYPAILDEGLPSQRSLWEQRWPLAQLLADRFTKDGRIRRPFALNMMNDPPADGSGAYWTRSSFRYAEAPQVLWTAGRWILWVDPAKETHATSDHTALVVAASLPTESLAWVIHAEAGFYPPAKTKERIAALREYFPGLRTFVERNTIGSKNAKLLYGLQRGDEDPWSESPKELRIRSAADLFDVDGGLVRFGRRLPQLEDALVEYPAGPRDDLPDALAGALGVVLPGRIPK